MFQTTLIRIPSFGFSGFWIYLAPVCFGFRSAGPLSCFGFMSQAYWGGRFVEVVLPNIELVKNLVSFAQILQRFQSFGIVGAEGEDFAEL